MGQGCDKLPLHLQPSLRSVQTSAGANQLHWLPNCSLAKQPFPGTAGGWWLLLGSPPVPPNAQAHTQHATSSPSTLLASSTTFASQCYYMHVFLNEWASTVKLNKEKKLLTSSITQTCLWNHSFFFQLPGEGGMDCAQRTAVKHNTVSCSRFVCWEFDVCTFSWNYSMNIFCKSNLFIKCFR